MITEIIKQIEKLNKEHIIIAIDGDCASGKTTFANELLKHLDANIFHMDDFFLQPSKRTLERLNEIGGNVDRERFLEEVLIPLSNHQVVDYQPFNCRKQALEKVYHIPYKHINIIEGSYSMHPDLFDYYDITIFLSIPSDLQIQRLKIRNPDKLERFIHEWIPKEKSYFNEFAIKEKAQFII